MSHRGTVGVPVRLKGWVGALGLVAACGNSAGSSPTTGQGGSSVSAADAGRGGVDSVLTSRGGASAGNGDGGAVPISGAAGLAVDPAGGNSSAGGAAGAGGVTGSGGSEHTGGNGGGGTGVNAGNGGGGTPGSTEPFTCTLLFGVSPTGQWFDSGFLDQVDGTRWESIWVAHHYTNFWADPADSAWKQALEPYPGPAHACARNSTSPDRVVFVAVNWAYTTAAQWQTDLDKIVANLRQKYAALRRIELMTLTRAPGNVVCATGGSSSETIIPAWTDVAIAATAAKYPDLVVPAPKFEVPQCADFMQGGLAPQYTDAGARDVAQVIGAYYAAHP